MDPEARQRQLVELAQRLRAARKAGARPAVQLFEDLHWMDGASEAFLAAMVDVLPETRTLLVVTFRPEYRGAVDGERLLPAALAPSSSVPRRSRNCSTAFSAATPRWPALPNGSASGRAETLFTEEVVQSLFEAGVLGGARGAHRLVRPVERLEIPASVAIDPRCAHRPAR